MKFYEPNYRYFFELIYILILNKPKAYYFSCIVACSVQFLLVKQDRIELEASLYAAKSNILYIDTKNH